jgi:hypothetical protein
LAEHFVAGRLSWDELESMGWATRPVTEVELRQLIADLPRIPAPASILTAAPPPVGGPTWPAPVVLAVVGASASFLLQPRNPVERRDGVG